MQIKSLNLSLNIGFNLDLKPGLNQGLNQGLNPNLNPVEMQFGIPSLNTFLLVVKINYIIE